MKRKSILTLVLFFMGLGALMFQPKEVKAWNVGTDYGLSSNFHYRVTSAWNTYPGANNAIKDEAKEAGGGYRKLSDGNIWISKGWTGSFNVVNPFCSKSPITSVVAAQSGLVQITRKTTGSLEQLNNEYNVLGLAYGSTTIRVTRKNGDYFDIPVKISKGIELYNDEGRKSKDVILGLGQTIMPSTKVSTDPYGCGNKPVGYIWVSENTNIVSIINGNQWYAKGKGTTIVRCKLYDCLRAYNKWHYADADNKDYGLNIMYSVKVQEDSPTIELKDSTGEVLNQKVKEKFLGERISLKPSLTGVNSIVWQYETSDKNIATVDEIGNVTAVGVGTATITVKGAEQKQTFTINVTSSGQDKITELKGINLKVPGNSMTLGTKLNLLSYYATNPLNTKLYSFKATTSDNSVIAVEGNNMLLAQKLGKSKITVVVSDYTKKEFKVSADIIVKLQAPTIKVEKSKNKNVISFKKVAGAKKYLIYRSSEESKGYKMIGETTTESYTDKVSSKKACCYRVVATNGTKLYNSDYSNTVVASIETPKIKSIKKKGKIYIVKLKGKKYTGFEVYYGTNKKAKKRIGSTTTKKFGIVIKLKKHKKYYFKVRSYKKSGNSKIRSAFSKVYKYKVK